MKKMKCMEEGGEIEFETAQGQNKNIDDDVRARAMAAIAAGMKDEEEVAKPKAKPAAPKAKAKEEKKKYIDIPKDSTIGMRQFRSDAESPIGKMFRSMTGSKAKGSTNMKAGGKVSSASSRADGCAVKGKTRGRMV